MPAGSLITVGQLMDEIGGGTYDTTAVGHLTTQMLQDVINRYAASYEARIIEILATKQAPSPILDSVETTITMSAWATNTNLVQGTLPLTYIPWLLDVVDNSGNVLDYEADLQQEVQNAPWVRTRWTIRGNTVLAAPNTITSIKGFVMAWDSDAPGQIAPGLADQMNEKIIAAATAMLAKRIAEQTRITRSDFDS